jgi:Transcriptional activator of glycolytic enzymes
VGLGNGLSVQELEGLYGPSRRPAHSKKAIYSRRKVIIDEVRRQQVGRDQYGRGGGRGRANATARSTVPTSAASIIELAEEICPTVATFHPNQTHLDAFSPVP